MRLERRLEGRDEQLKLVEGQTGEIQELRGTGLQIGELHMGHRWYLLSWEAQYIINRDNLNHTPPRWITSRPAFFYDPATQRSRHLVRITLIERQLVCNLLVRQVEPHKIQTQDPHFQRLVMSGKNRVGQIIKTCVTVVTLIALTGWFRVIKAT